MPAKLWGFGAVAALGVVVTLGAASSAIATVATVGRDLPTADSPIGVCHRTGSPTKPVEFIIVSASALPALLARGDVVVASAGDCAATWHYVTDSLRFGQTANEAVGYALDLNGDGRKDNSIGFALAVISTVVDFDTPLADSVRTGQVVILHSLRAGSLNKDTEASWHVRLGVAQPNPVLTGGGTFTVDAGAPVTTPLTGPLERGSFAGGPGVVFLRLGLVPGQPPIEVRLAGARLVGQCDLAGCRGKVGGGVSTRDVDALIIPAMAARMQAVIDADPSSGPASLILGLFDPNGDSHVSADEVRDSFIIQAIFAPDLDLVDADGEPGTDGVRESLSLGLGFDAKPALIAP